LLGESARGGKKHVTDVWVAPLRGGGKSRRQQIQKEKSIYILVLLKTNSKGERAKKNIKIPFYVRDTKKNVGKTKGDISKAN